MGKPKQGAAEQIVLGIETSCDETAAAVIRRAARGSGEILSNIVLSQLEDHAPYGGVVPEIAARAHVANLDNIIAQALTAARLDWRDLTGIAGTAGPGLIGGVIVGLVTAKSIALVHQLPLCAVNHLEGHLLTARLTDAITFPYLCLLVSGGHTQLLIAEDVGRYRLLGTTIDDALGEAFDKTAKLLGMGYPGGPAVEAAAQNGDPTRFKFPRPLMGRDGCDFSFSGLKTALRREAEKLDRLDKQAKADICSSFQAAICDVVQNRTQAALELFQQQYPDLSAPHMVVAGGVAANSALKSTLNKICEAEGFQLIAPPPELCTDNAAMIAWAGAERLARGLTDPLDCAARARWPLDPTSGPKASSKTGAGTKA